MNKKTLWIDLQNEQLVSGQDNRATPKLRFVQGDTTELVLRGLVPAVAADSFSLFAPSRIEYATLAAGIYKTADEAPTAGTVKLQVGSQLTATLAAGISKADFAAALNALSGVVSAGGVTVTSGGRANIYRVQWNTPDNALTITAPHEHNKLQPLSMVVISEDDSVPGKVNVKFRQAPMAFTDDFAAPTPPPPTISRFRTGTTARNEVQRLVIPPGAMGGFAFTVAAVVTRIVQVSEASATTIATALNEVFTEVAAADVRFSVSQAATGVFDIEFIGAYAKQGFSELPLTLYDQVALDMPTGRLALTGVAVEDFLDGASSKPALLEIVAADAEGRERTLVLESVTVVNDGIDAGATGEFISAVATRTETVYVYPADTDPVAIALLGQKFVPASVSVDETLTHNFGTKEVDVVVLRQTAVSPAQFEGVSPTEYEWVTLNDNQVRIWLGFTPTTSGIGSIEVWVRTLNAVPITNDHRHSTDAIDGVGDDVGKTLTDIIAELRNALPDGWPSIPASKLVGLISPDQIDLEALAKALRTSPAFLETLRTLITDATLLDLIGDGLATSDKFLTTLKTLMANAEVLAALMDSLKGNSDFLQIVRSAVLDALQSGEQVDAVVFQLADIDRTVPPLVEAGVYAPLVAAVYNPTNGGTASGVLGTAASQAGKKFTVSGSATAKTATNRRGAIFPDAAVIASNGVHWFPADIIGSTAYDATMNQELCTLFVNDAMLVANTRFSLDFTLQLALAGLARGFCLMRIRTAVAAAAGTADISTLTWTDRVTQQIILTPANTFHRFVYRVSCANDLALSATAMKYGHTASTTAPAGRNFAVRAELAGFDTENVTNPRGAMHVKMAGGTASIVTV